MGKYMDNLPTVISCCFCCFLRAGSVMIALVSFIIGIILAPNVSHARGYWTLHGLLNSTDTPLETAAQTVLGFVSILLCVASLFLLIGSLCNFPKLLEYYQWGAVMYSGVTVLVYFTLATYCFAAQTNCFAAGSMLLFIIASNILFTAYFIIVVNSLRMSMIYLANSSILDV